MVVMLRPYRTQVLLGHALLALAVYLAAPVEKASLWPLEIWGGLHIPVWVWPALLGLTGLPLARTRKARIGMLLCQLSVIWLVTVGIAAYLAAGWNPVSVLCAVLALHAQWTSVDLKAVAAALGTGSGDRVDIELIGKILGWTTAGTMALTGVWTYFGKSKDSAWSRLVSENDRVRKDLQEMKTELKSTNERLGKVETELEELRADRRTLLDFLRDVVSGQFPPDWIQTRARELLARMGRGTP